MTTTAGRGLVLVGYRGTGKTTVGERLGRRLGLDFVDSDREIEARYGEPVAAIFRRRGEAAFRDMEEATIEEITAHRPCVLATGGGAVLRASNRQALRSFGLVVWLTAPPAEIAARLAAEPGGAERPPLTAAGTLAEVADVLRLREPLYRETAHAVVDTLGRAPADVAEAVVELLAGQGFELSHGARTPGKD